MDEFLEQARWSGSFSRASARLHLPCFLPSPPKGNCISLKYPQPVEASAERMFSSHVEEYDPPIYYHLA